MNKLSALFLATFFSSCTMKTPVITVERSLFINGRYGTPTVVLPMAPDQFLVAGSRFAFSKTKGGQGELAWAAAIDSQGKLSWTYTDSPSQLDANGGGSELTSGIALRDGRTLLCGSKFAEHFGEVGLILILDQQGHLIEERHLSPEDRPNDEFTIVTRCLRWADRIAVLAVHFNHTMRFGWIILLDEDGKQVGEQRVSSMGLGRVVDPHDGYLYMEAQSGISVIRIASDGTVSTSEPMRGTTKLAGLAPVFASDSTFWLAHGPGPKWGRYELGKDLRMAPPATLDGAFDISEGVGFVLPDKSTILFGRDNDSESSGSWRATIAYWDSNGRRRDRFVQHATDVLSGYSVVNYLGDGRFLAARDSLPPGSGECGFALDWVRVAK